MMTDEQKEAAYYKAHNEIDRLRQQVMLQVALSVAWKCCRVPMCAKMIFDMRQK